MQIVSSMTVKEKLFLLLFFNSMFVFIVGSVGVTTTYLEGQNLKRTNFVVLPAIRAVAISDMYHDGMRSIVYQALYQRLRNSNNATILAEYNEMSSSFSSLLKKAKALDLSPLEKQKIDQARESLQKYAEAGKTTISDALGNRAYEPSLKIFEGQFLVLEESLEQLADLIEKDSQAATEESSEFNRIMQGVSLGLMLIAILIGIVTAYYFIHLINSQIKSSIDKVSKASSNLIHVSSRLNQLAKSIINGTQGSASSIQEIVSSMSEINSIVTGTKDRSHETETSAATVSHKVTEGTDNVNMMAISMQEIKTSDERLSELNRIMKSISKQTGLINDIVFKTQLLAVNAAIESSKAGEQGKGFSVVSDEISKLAKSSGEAASQITELIDNSQEKVTELLSSINRNVVDGVNHMSGVKKLFDDILLNTKSIAERTKEMKVSSEEQMLGVQQITSAVCMLEQVAQDNLKDVNSLEAIAGDLQKQSHVLIHTSEDLWKLISHPKLESKSTVQSKSVLEDEPLVDANEDDIDADDESFKQAG